MHTTDEIHAWRKGSTHLLPEDVRDLTWRIIVATDTGELMDEDLPRVLMPRLDTLPAECAPQLARVIREAANAAYRINAPAQGLKAGHTLPRVLSRLLSPWKGRAPARGTSPDLDWLLLLHPDGYLRQRALEDLQVAPGSALRLAILLMRLSDWVPDVRTAARDAFRRLTADIPAPVFVDALPFHLRQAPHARRIDVMDADILSLLSRADIRAELLSRLMQDPLAQSWLFRQVLCYSDTLDPYLPALAKGARPVAIRARALKVLLNGEVDGVATHGRRTVSERLGVYAYMQVNTVRPVVVSADIATLISMGARDRAVAVRKVAADGLIRHRRALADVPALAALFDAEKNAAVLDRIDFLKRQIATA